MTKESAISFVIPALNEEEWILPCIRSILAQKDLPPHEIIVVDNGSTDRTVALVEECFADVRLVHEPEKGLTRARQAGFRASSGNIIACVDADTQLPAHWAKTVLEALEERSAIVAVSGPARYPEFSTVLHSASFVFWHILVPTVHSILHVTRWGAIGNGGNMAIRRHALETIGGFDTSIVFWGEDTNIARRLRSVGEVKFLRRMTVESSARRFLSEGTFRTLARYLSAFFLETIKTKKALAKKDS